MGFINRVCRRIEGLPEYKFEPPKVREEIKERQVEGREKMPSLEIRIHYGTHQTEKDAQFLDRELPKADVYCPETAFHIPMLESDYRDLSFGRMKLKDFVKKYKPTANFPEFVEAEASILANSKKEIMLLDIEEKDYWKYFDPKEPQRSYFLERSLEAFLLGDFKKAIEMQEKGFEKEAERAKIREGVIKEKLENLRNKIIEKRPEWKNRENIKILVNLGAIHTRLYHKLKESLREGKQEDKIVVEAEFEKPNLTYSLEEVQTRRKIFFPEEKLSSEAMTEFVWQTAIPTILKAVFWGKPKIPELSKDFIKTLTYQDLQEISENLKKMDAVWNDKERARAVLDFLKEKGFEEFLQERKVKLPKVHF